MRLPELIRLIFGIWIRLVAFLRSLLDPFCPSTSRQSSSSSSKRNISSRITYFPFVFVVFGGITTLLVCFFKLMMSVFRRIPNFASKDLYFRARNPKQAPVTSPKRKTHRSYADMKVTPQEYQCYHLRNQGKKRPSESDDPTEENPAATNESETQTTTPIRNLPPPVQVELGSRELEITHDGNTVRLNFNPPETEAIDQAGPSGVKAHKRRKTEESPGDLQLEGLGQRLLQSIPLASIANRPTASTSTFSNSSNSASNFVTEPISGLQMLIESVKFVESSADNNGQAMDNGGCSKKEFRHKNRNSGGATEDKETMTVPVVSTNGKSCETVSGGVNILDASTIDEAVEENSSNVSVQHNLDMKFAELSLDDKNVPVHQAESEEHSLQKNNELDVVVAVAGEVEETVESVIAVIEAEVSSEVSCGLSESSDVENKPCEPTKSLTHHSENNSAVSDHQYARSSATAPCFPEEDSIIPVSPVEIKITDSSFSEEAYETEGNFDMDKSEKLEQEVVKSDDAFQKDCPIEHQPQIDASNQPPSCPAFRFAPPNRVTFRPQVNPNDENFVRPSILRSALLNPMMRPAIDGNGNIQFIFPGRQDYRRRSESDVEERLDNSDRNNNNNNNHHSTSCLISTAECEAAEALIDLKGCEDVFLPDTKSPQKDQDIHASSDTTDVNEVQDDNQK